MAQKVQVILVDDVDGGEASETVSFSLDGVSYEIDVSESNAGALRDALAPWVGHARRVGGRSGGSGGGGRAESGGGGGPPPPPRDNQPHPARRAAGGRG